MSYKGAPGDCCRAGNRSPRESARAGAGASKSESGCEDAAIVLVCDMRQASLFTGLRDLLWFLLDIAFTNTGWPQGGQQAPEYASRHQRGKNNVGNRKHKTASTGTSEGQPGGVLFDDWRFLMLITSSWCFVQNLLPSLWRRLHHLTLIMDEPRRANQLPM